MQNIKNDVVLAPYTTFKIGGVAKYFIETDKSEEISEICLWAKEKNIPIFVLGGGSNVLISDKGFDGLVIKIKNSELEIKDNKIKCDAGVSLAKLVFETVKNGLSGLEWAVGIPGTVGGAVVGNAGAFGKSTADNLKEVVVFDISNMRTKIFKKEDLNFSYRNSYLKRNSNFIVLSVLFELNKEKEEIIKDRINNFTKQRVESNPIGFSAGCFFENIGWENLGDKNKILERFPELDQFKEKPKISAGFLIEKVGLKGKKIGDATISLKHANFIINEGKAKASDVRELADLVKKEIHNHYNFDLEEEIVRIG